MRRETERAAFRAGFHAHSTTVAPGWAFDTATRPHADAEEREAWQAYRTSTAALVCQFVDIEALRKILVDLEAAEATYGQPFGSMAVDLERAVPGLRDEASTS